MVTYMGNFIPHLSHHTEPLRQLLKKDVMFYWDDQLTRSFQEIKHLLKKATSKPLGYYNRRKEVIVQADASLRGLGACLIQDGKPITFASKSLTGAESRYANIENCSPLSLHAYGSTPTCKGAGSQFSQTISLWK